MNLFHIYLYGPPQDEASGHPRLGNAIPTSFESASERLSERLPGVLLEPDGSLAWGDNGYQIVGMIYDAASLIQYVELRGSLLPSLARPLNLSRDLRSLVETLVETLVGSPNISELTVMVLPERQWKNFQSFANSLPLRGPSNA